MKLLAGVIVLASCAPACYQEHGHHPHGHHPVCESFVSSDRDDKTPPPIEPPPPPELDAGHNNNGFGSGNQDASGKSEDHNNAENAGGNN